MIEPVKCECGHANPLHTLLCESCGKPQDESSGEGLLEMRYDGVARRSQKTDPDVWDKLWRFFSSVKVAIYLIVFTLVGASLGTIYPQETTLIAVDGFRAIDPFDYYEQNYGLSGKIYYTLGLSDTFNSWWLKLLLIMIGTSLVICSLDRILPLYRALSKQHVRKHEQFLLRQRLRLDYRFEENGLQPADWMNQFAEEARKRRYDVTLTGDALLAEKNRFSRWGPYVNHIGLIIFLIALVFRGMVPAWTMDQYVSFPEGEIRKVPDTPFYLENKRFTVEFYENSDTPKLYQTDAILYRCKADCDNPTKEPQYEKIMEDEIRVNEPMNYDGYLFYQFQFAVTEPQLRSINVTLRERNKENGKAFGQFELSLKNPKPSYQAGDYTLTLIDYKPDFTINDSDQPVSKTRNPKAPAYVFRAEGPAIPQGGETFIYFPLPKDKQFFREADLNERLGSTLELGINGMEDLRFTRSISYLNIRTDRVLPYVFAGMGIFLIGVVMGLYWQHRRIWFRIDRDRLILGSHTNKNWLGMRKELHLLLERSGLKTEESSLEVLESPKHPKEINQQEKKGDLKDGLDRN